MASGKKKAAKKVVRASKPEVLESFAHPFTVDIVAPTFVPFASVATQDVAKLSKGRHRIEVGHLGGGCCPKLLYAVIRNGMVTALEAEPCEDSEPIAPKSMSKELAAVVAIARRRVEQDPWKPIPVEEFLGAVADTADPDHYPPRWGTGAGCVYVCLGYYCIFCCLRAGISCWVETRKPDVIM